MPDTLKKLREIWKLVDEAKNRAEQARKCSHDHITVAGAAAFAVEHLEKALKLIEELGKSHKR